MTQIFSNDGRFIPVTKISVEPNTILRVKNKEKDGYEAVVVGYGTKNKVKKSLLGLFKKFGKFKYVREFKLEGQEIDLKPGDKIGLNSFNVKDKVKVSSISKGKGFQGVVKRHGFHGQSAGHGNKDQLRMPGSIGATGPAHVFKGQKMPGRMGGQMTTVSNLEIVKIDFENNLLYIKGAFAGGSNALVAIKGDGELKVYEVPVSSSAEAMDDKKEKIKVEDKKEKTPKEESKLEKPKKESSSTKVSDDKETPKEDVKSEVSVDDKKEEVPEKKDDK